MVYHLFTVISHCNKWYHNVSLVWDISRECISHIFTCREKGHDRLLTLMITALMEASCQASQIYCSASCHAIDITFASRLAEIIASWLADTIIIDIYYYHYWYWYWYWYYAITLAIIRWHISLLRHSPWCDIISAACHILITITLFSPFAYSRRFHFRLPAAIFDFIADYFRLFSLFISLHFHSHWDIIIASHFIASQPLHALIA